MIGRVRAVVVLGVACGVLAYGEDQVWTDGTPDKIWSTAAPNWAGGAVWTNGNSAIFTGGGGTQTGETVEVAEAVTVANLTFQTNGYVIADADGDGALAFAGGGDVHVSTGSLVVVSEAAGGAGFRKTGLGVFQLSGANTFTGVVRVSEGTLRLSKYEPAALGATGAGNGTVVESGATLDIFGAFTNNLNRAESLDLAGTGVGGAGALINTGVGCMNSGFSGTTTLRGDTTVGCYSRIDFRGNVAGNGHTLTKTGGAELAVGVEVNTCKIVINAGTYTYMNARALGTNDFDTTINGGALRSYGNQTVTERLVCNGGAIIAAGSGVTLFKINGQVLLNSNIVVTTESVSELELSGLFEGPGGLRRSGGSKVYVTSPTNTFTGPTLVDGGSSLYIGKTNLYAGRLSSQAVTNNGTLYGFSDLICTGRLVNAGSLYCMTGWVSEAGEIVNTGTLQVDRGGDFAVSNAISGGGVVNLRYGGHMSLSGGSLSNGTFRVAAGSLTLTNGASLAVSRFNLSDRSAGVGYPVDPTNVTAELVLRDGALLQAYSVEAGNGNTVAGGGMTGLVWQTGGLLRTTGWSGDPVNFPGEYDGLRVAHYPQAFGVYTLSGGSLVVDNGHRLCVATDGTGWLRQTGGEVFASELVVNARSGGGGYGRLTVEGGVLNVGSNGVTAGSGAPYLVELGGQGGTVRASTNFASSLRATLSGDGAGAAVFDTAGWTVGWSGNLSGAGGLAKKGAGELVLSGSNTFSGATQIWQGRLIPASARALPLGGQVLFGVAADDAGGTLHAAGDFSLSELNVGVANPQDLDTSKHYTVVTCDGELSGMAAGDTLPAPWYLYYDWANDRVELRAAIGTMVLLR